MLILSRRVGESIYIGDGDRRIQVTVLGVKGMHVRIGIDAPKDIEVHREEVYERLREQRRPREA